MLMSMVICFISIATCLWRFGYAASHGIKTRCYAMYNAVHNTMHIVMRNAMQWMVMNSDGDGNE